MSEPHGPVRPETADPRHQPDEHHDQHHGTRNTWLAIVLVTLLLGAMVWVAKLVVDQQNLEKCIASGRRDCLMIEAPDRQDNPVEILKPQR